MTVTRVATASVAAAGVAVLAAIAGRSSAQTREAHRLVWRGHIADERAEFGRAKSGGDVPRMPQPYTYAHTIAVDFEYVQQIESDGSVSWPKRHLTWTLEGMTGDDTFTETCRGGGSLDLAPAASAAIVTASDMAALRARCVTTQTAIAFRLYGSLPQTPPLPVIPGVDALDESCAFREDTGSRHTTVWLTPDVEAVVDMNSTPGSPYQQWVPEPGKTLEISVKTVPAYPARFRFVIENDRTSHFAGYAGNAYIDQAFFKRYHLEHLSKLYSDDSPDLIFDPRMFDGRRWSRVDQDIVDTADDRPSATAQVTAMDYGAIGKVRAYAKFRCGGWVPAKVVVGGKPHDAVSIPLDEDDNLMADSLTAYVGDPGRDEDSEPEGDGTKGDGFTAFEEYRGFMTAGHDCDDPVSDKHLRTSPRQKNLFIMAIGYWPRFTETFGQISGLAVVDLCTRQITDIDAVTEAWLNVDAPQESLPVRDDSRVVNFTLYFEGQQEFRGHTISLPTPQHGVIVIQDMPEHPLLNGLFGRAVPIASEQQIGPPAYTAVVLASRRNMSNVLFTGIHELGHAIGIPHHSDDRVDWHLKLGAEDIQPQASDYLLVEPGADCREGHIGAAYRDGTFVGCLTGLIIRRGQQRSGDVMCPMRYTSADFYEPPGVQAASRGSSIVTTSPGTSAHEPVASSQPAGSGSDPHGFDQRTRPETTSQDTFSVEVWGGDLREWKSDPRADWGTGKLCASPRGTGINAVDGSGNLAGDARRDRGCSAYLVVKDGAAPKPR